MFTLSSLKPCIHKIALLALIALALYAPAKDFSQFMQSYLARESVVIVDASFGHSMPWQTPPSSYLKVSQQAQTSLTQPQIVYTKLRLENPTAKPQTYRKIWLNFSHQNGEQEYATDYTLYNVETRQRLVGQSIQLGSNSHLELVAAHRYIPNQYRAAPVSMSVTWESEDHLRKKVCDYSLVNTANNTFQFQCL